MFLLIPPILPTSDLIKLKVQCRKVVNLSVIPDSSVFDELG